MIDEWIDFFNDNIVDVCNMNISFDPYYCKSKFDKYIFKNNILSNELEGFLFDWRNRFNLTNNKVT
jgi:hypothetical protein